jgi:hypothetical protein
MDRRTDWLRKGIYSVVMYMDYWCFLCAVVLSDHGMDMPLFLVNLSFLRGRVDSVGGIGMARAEYISSEWMVGIDTDLAFID